MLAIPKAEFYGILTDLDSLGVRQTAALRKRSTALVSRINAAKRYIDRGDLDGLRKAYLRKQTSKTFYVYADSMIRAQRKRDGVKETEMLVYSPIVPVCNELIKTMNECMALLSEIMDLYAGNPDDELRSVPDMTEEEEERADRQRQAWLDRIRGGDKDDA